MVSVLGMLAGLQEGCLVNGEGLEVIYRVVECEYHVYNRWMPSSISTL